MKTILVIYTTNKIDNSAILYKTKKYSFRVKDDSIKVGDMISSPSYGTPMQVVRVLDTEFKYFNTETGELTNTFNNSKLGDIRELVIREEEQDVVYGKIM